MSLSESLHRRAGRAALLVLASCILATLVGFGTASAAKRKAHHHRHLSAPQALRVVTKARTRADHALVARARAVRHCLRKRHHHCAKQRRALQRAGVHLQAVNHFVSAIAGQGKLGHLSSIRRAPHLRVRGRTLSWHRVGHVRSYVIVRQVPGQAAQYSVTRHTRVKPPVVPGVTVHYSVRTNVSGSAWARPVSIAYPALVSKPKPAPVRGPAGSPAPAPVTKPVSTPPAVSNTTAPTVTVSGQTLRWTKIADVTTYVLVAHVAGRTDQYSEVSGTSVTPAAQPGATVSYSVRTAVNGSAWSVPVSIAYPAAPAPNPAPEPPSTSFGKMAVGLNGGSWGTAGVSDVHNAVNYVRLDSLLGANTLRQYAGAGVKVDLDFSGPYTSSGVSGLNASAWVSNALSFYSANTNPSQTPMIEVLNEAGGTWFWGPNATSQQNADAYRNLIQMTYNAFHAKYGASAPKILATFDGSGGMTWGQRWWNSSAASFVDGIVVHPYGGTGSRTSSALGNRQRVIDVHNYTGKPIYATEVGWPTCTSCSPTSDSLQWSDADQATNLTNFMDWARSTGFVAAVMYFNYRDFGGSNWYGVEHSDGTKKPAYYALQAEAQK